MSESPNPYQSPTLLPVAPSRLSAFWRLLFRVPVVRYFAYRRGDIGIVDGVAFYVDSEDSSNVYAVSPSSITTDARMRLVESEVIRVMPYLFSRRSGASSLFHGRTLVIRLVNSYEEAKTSVLRETTLPWNEVVKRLPEIESL
ncbi:hypothetical protein [Rhodopirellula sp. SWK7]|uniref:hypothetical protein n=1 Tax=Rhodopirellula sp. SWK7 TaxID=595460 RepID=UPI0002BE9012|nr:hypothetical protein [Rhodopirellula sp. SWK7]EMI45442.1 hypothetical protein RRSWK_01846 [Rhodopirellula sp. SWK7]